MEIEPLLELNPDEWQKIQREFKQDWPRGCPAYYILETQKEWLKRGLDYGFKVFSPYGEALNGMVALNDKRGFYEIVIQCPNDNTRRLEEALSKTKIIDWTRSVIVPFAPDHIVECIRRLVANVNIKIDSLLQSESFILHKTTKRFNIILPKDIHFEPLQLKHVEVVDSNWAHRYSTSPWYFHQLITAESGYGLFKNSHPIVWIFIYEQGTIGNLYTVENYRRKGYAELLLKIICNKLFDDGKDAFAFSVKGNNNSSKLFRKVGFENFCQVTWCYLKPKL